MNADAFSIVSSISSSEVTVGAWIFDRKDYNRLQDMREYLDFVIQREWFNNVERTACQNLVFLSNEEIYNDRWLGLTNFPLGEMSILRRGLQKIGEEQAFFEKWRNFKIQPKKVLNLVQVDSSLCFLNCDGMEEVQKFEHPDFSHLNKLVELRCNALEIKSLRLPVSEHLELLDCSCNSLKNLDVTKCENLIKLDFSLNELTEIDLSNNQNMNEVYAQSNYLKNINFGSQSKDEGGSVICWGNNLNELDIRTFPDCDVECDDRVNLISTQQTYNEDDEVTGQAT